MLEKAFGRHCRSLRGVSLVVHKEEVVDQDSKEMEETMRKGELLKGRFKSLARVAVARMHIRQMGRFRR